MRLAFVYDPDLRDLVAIGLTDKDTMEHVGGHGSLTLTAAFVGQLNGGATGPCIEIVLFMKDGWIVGWASDEQQSEYNYLIQSAADEKANPALPAEKKRAKRKTHPWHGLAEETPSSAAAQTALDLEDGMEGK